MTIDQLQRDGGRVFINHFRYHGEGESLDSHGFLKKEGVAPDPKGGYTFVRVVLPSGRVLIGESLCSREDPFSRKSGRELAFDRALLAALGIGDGRVPGR